MAQGYLQVDVVSDANSFPVQDADIVIARTEEPDEIIEETRTNSSGQTENLPLDAPPLELSLSPEAIFQGHSILRVQNCRQLYLKPYSGVALPMTEIVLSVLLHLPMMKICRSVGNSF